MVPDVSYIGKLDTEAIEENVRDAKSIGVNLNYVPIKKMTNTQLFIDQLL